VKIGILTYFWVDNPGQFLQAYSTQQALAEAMPSARVEIVNVRHRPPGPLRWRRLLRPRRFLTLRRRQNAYRQAQGQLQISEASLMTHDYDQANAFVDALGYDLLCVGSDVVLSMPKSSHMRNGRPPVYWLAPSVRAERVMLAASAGQTRWDLLTDAQRDMLRASAERFAFFGVRDEMTSDLLADMGFAGDDRLRLVPDPTFTYRVPASAVQEARERLGRLRLRPDRPIVGLHLPDNALTRAILAGLRAARPELQFLCTSSRALPGCLGLCDLSPWQWAGMFGHLGAMLTVSFHDSVFCLKQGTPVVAIDVSAERIDVQTNRSKTRHLMAQFGLQASNHVNPHAMTDTQAICRAILAGWDTFDGAATRIRAAQLAREYLQVVQHVVCLAGESVGSRRP
jgi:hypothetical protein